MCKHFLTGTLINNEQTWKRLKTPSQKQIMLSVPSMEEDSEFDINIARVPGVDVTCSDPTVFNKISDSISSERSEDPNGTGARKEQRDLHACPKGDTLKKLCR